MSAKQSSIRFLIIAHLIILAIGIYLVKNEEGAYPLWMDGDSHDYAITGKGIIAIAVLSGLFFFYSWVFGKK